MRVKHARNGLGDAPPASGPPDRGPEPAHPTGLDSRRPAGRYSRDMDLPADPLRHSRPLCARSIMMPGPDRDY